MEKYVSAVMLSQGLEEICLILKETPSWQKGNYNLIGGKVEHDEEPVHAIIREVTEETGVVTVEDDWTFVVTAKSDTFTLDIFVMSSNDIFNAKTITDEMVVIHDVNKLPNNLVHQTDKFIARALKVISAQ